MEADPPSCNYTTRLNPSFLTSAINKYFRTYTALDLVTLPMSWLFLLSLSVQDLWRRKVVTFIQNLFSLEFWQKHQHKFKKDLFWFAGSLHEHLCFFYGELSTISLISRIISFESVIAILDKKNIYIYIYSFL